MNAFAEVSPANTALLVVKVTTAGDVLLAQTLMSSAESAHHFCGLPPESRDTSPVVRKTSHYPI
jgi:hypothetical protein